MQNSSLNNTKYVSRHELVFQPGTAARGLFLVQSGKVMTFQVSDGRIIPLSLANAGDFLGEDAVFHQDNYVSYAVALEDSSLAPITKDSIMEVIMNSPDWVKNLVQTMATRLASTQDIIKEFKILDPELTDFVEMTPQLENQLNKIVQAANA
ncbi:MAG: Crp/Fnr family transcriptional regulator [Bacteriovoracaceae bacterium]